MLPRTHGDNKLKWVHGRVTGNVPVDGNGNVPPVAPGSYVSDDLDSDLGDTKAVCIFLLQFLEAADRH